MTIPESGLGKRDAAAAAAFGIDTLFHSFPLPNSAAASTSVELSTIVVLEDDD